MKTIRIASMVLVVAAALSGCATLQDARRENRVQAAAFGRIAERRAPVPVHPVLTWHDTPYMAGSWVAPPKKVPAFLNDHVVYESARRQTIYQVAAQLARLTGVRVAVHDLMAPSSSMGTTTNPQSNPAQSLMGGGLGLGMQGGLNGDNLLGLNPDALMADEYPGAITGRVHWSGGALRGLLADIAARWGVYWRVHHGGIEFYKFATRTYPVGLVTLTGKVNYSIANSVGSPAASGTAGTSGTASSGSAGTTGGGTLAVSGSNVLQSYQDVLSGVRTILASAGQDQGEAVVSPGLGTVTVTATPPVQRMVRAYLRGLARDADRNVAVRVRVYQVTLSNSADYGASLSAAFENAAQSIAATTSGVNLTGALGNPANGMGALSLIIPSAAKGGLPGDFAGTQAVLQALDSVGRTSLVTSGSVITENGEPGPIQSAQEITYLASSGTTDTANVGSTSTLTPGTQTVGFTADFLPRILPRGRILLSYQIQLSSLISLTTVSSGGSTIQVPDIQTQSDAQSVVLKSGQTLVMAGFGQTRHTHGVGVGLLSGYRQHDGSRTELVIMIHIAEVRS